jgi:hypothetical protein
MGSGDARGSWSRVRADPPHEGWSWVAADRIYAVAEEITAPHQMGFERIRKGFFARLVDADITHVLRLSPYKGYQYGFTWGVSLAVVPHEWKRGLRFHRSLKTAHLDLWENAHEEKVREGGNERDGFASGLRGERTLRRELERSWKFVAPRAETWWASTTTLEGVLNRAREQVTRPPASTDKLHNPRPELVMTFVLATLGQMEDAVRTLDEFIAQRAPEMAPPERDNLRSALQRVGRS